MIIPPPPNSHTSRNHQIQHLDPLVLNNQFPQFSTLPAHPPTSRFPCKREIKSILIRVWPAAAGTSAAARAGGKLREAAGSEGCAAEDGGGVEVWTGVLGFGGGGIGVGVWTRVGAGPGVGVWVEELGEGVAFGG